MSKFCILDNFPEVEHAYVNQGCIIHLVTFETGRFALPEPKQRRFKCK